MYTPDLVSGLAAQIYGDIGSPTSSSVQYISGWLTQQQSLGKLNIKLSTTFWNSGGSIVDTFWDDEAAIYSMVYKTEFYEQKSLAVLTGADLGNISWTNMKEGDTSITKEGFTAVSKAYLALQQQSQTQLRLAIQDYKRKFSVIQGTDAEQSYSWPAP